jgi:hypothetical protein
MTTAVIEKQAVPTREWLMTDGCHWRERRALTRSMTALSCAPAEPIDRFVHRGSEPSGGATATPPVQRHEE